MYYKRIFSFFQKKRSWFLIAAFLVSLLMWFITNLSKEYTKVIPVTVEFSEINSGHLIKCNDSVLNVKIKGTGFSLWSNQLKTMKYTIPVKEYKTSWNWQQNQYLFSQTFPKNIEVVNVKPSAIAFTQFKLEHKKVVVQPQITIIPKLGYGITSYTVSPDSVLIYGHQNEIKKVNSIKTDSLVFNEVQSDVLGKVSVLLPSGILQISEKYLNYQYTIERYTQGEFLVPIQLMNVPEHLEVSIFPKQIQVQFQSPLSLFESYQSQHFLLTVDCSALENKKTLPILLKEIPNGLKNVRLLKKSVTFLVLEK